MKGWKIIKEDFLLIKNRKIFFDTDHLLILEEKQTLNFAYQHFNIHQKDVFTILLLFLDRL